MEGSVKAGTAFVDFHGDFSSLQKEVAAQITPLTGRFGKLGKAAGIGLAGVGIAAVGAGKALYDIGATFDDATDTIRVKTNATGKELQKLRDDFKAVYATVPSDSKAVATAIGDVHTRLSLTGKPLQDLTRQFLNLSRVTDTDIEANIRGVARALVDWDVPAKKQAKTLDGFFRLSTKSGASVEQLATQVQQFGSPLRQLGFHLDESAAMFANFERAGVNTQTMVPGLKLALSNLTRPTSTLATEMDKLGIKAGKPGPALRQVFSVLSDKGIPAAEKTGLAMDVFGKRAGADMAEAIKQGRFSVDDLVKSFNKGKGSINDAAKDTNDFAENWDILKHRLSVALEPAGTFVFDKINKGLSALTTLNLSGAINSLKEFWRNAGLVRTVMGAFSSGIGSVVKGVVQMFRGLAQSIKGVVQIVSGVLTGDWGRAWQGVKNLFGGGVKFVIGIVRTMTAPIRGVAHMIGNVFDGPISGIKRGFNSILSTVKSVAGKIPGALRSAASGLGGIAASIGTTIKNWVNDHTLFGDHVHIGVPGPVPDINFDIPALAAGGKVMAPMAIVGEEAPGHPEYVLATNPAYRKRNMDLWAAAGSDLGVPGFARGGVIRGRVSVFGPPLEAGGPGAFGDGVDHAGIALNPHPGTDAWNSPIITKWHNKHKQFQVTVAGKSAALPIVDKGPAGSTHRAIDITGAGVVKLGLSLAHFPTDAIGTARLVGGVDPLKTGKGKGSGKAKRLGLSPKLQQQINEQTSLSDIHADFAERANSLGEPVLGFDELHWLQQELAELFALRALLIRAIAQLNEALANLGIVKGKKGAKGKQTSTAGGDLGPHGENDGYAKSGLVDYPVPTGKIASWVAGALHWARIKHGFAGNPTSGYRDPAYNASIGGAPGSEHTQFNYPHGAVDFGGFNSGLATKMAAVHATSDYKWPLLAPIGFHDDGHASGTGHRRGGILGFLANHVLPGFAKGAGKKRTSKAAKKAAAAIQQQRDDITAKIGEVTSTLEDVQGVGSSMELGRSFAIGDLGGRILDVQKSIRDYGGDSGDSGGNAGPKGFSVDDLKSIMALKGLGVTFSPDQFAGVFHGGGVVPGPIGQERPALVQGGEGIFTREQLAAMGAEPSIYADIYIGGEKIDERVEVRLRQTERDDAIALRAGAPR